MREIAERPRLLGHALDVLFSGARELDGDRVDAAAAAEVLASAVVGIRQALKVRA